MPHRPKKEIENMNRIKFDSVIMSHNLSPITSKVIYDDSGVPQGFMANDASQYAFVRNLQGDVIALIDQNGETVILALTVISHKEI